ncbi:SpoIIAA-like protein [Gillisia sp. Hel_I_86]|uniref:STAS/SEC14 domain-containing protein n=1 Tax=Gillisia sp. Hel_I_86 TaxID=1249981 RepID=UPI0011993E10|nr:STAS/SEC14 domain-containing protein [Gillisia sp. Hel_I_86]TVZ27054.1 SpoIIAA-like protein [Gillisia sp. Hel_I_86]
MISTFEFANHVVGLIIDKDIEEGNLEAVHETILEKIAEFGEINIFCEIAHGKHIAFKCLMDELKFKFENSKNIDKLAIVTDLSWLRAVMNINDLIVHTNIHPYEIKDRMDAIQWVSQ